MNTSFNLLHAEQYGISTLYDVEFIVEGEIQSLLTIEVAGGKIQGIICFSVDDSSRIKHIMNDRTQNISSFIYSGVYFPEGKLLHMLDRAIDEYDDEIGGDL